MKKRTLLKCTMALLAAGVVYGGQEAKADSIHTVTEGDTLTEISEHYYGSIDFVQQIAAVNGIENVDLLFVGQSLDIVDNITEFEAATEVVPTQEVQSQTEAYQEPQAQEPVGTYQAPQATSDSELSAKEWIAFKESSGNYGAQNGRYYGRYQLDTAYLNGDLSPANQERVVEAYVAERYGSWTNAKAFWEGHNWY